MALALYRKYRPQTFQELIDQKHITTILEQEVANGKVAHAYLFSGPRGTGKTSAARIFSKAVNCMSRGVASESSRRRTLSGATPEIENGEPCNQCDACKTITEGKALDVIEIDAASYTGVDNVRETIIETAKFAPSKLKYRIFIIDEAHMLSNSAWNALLKIMEEPPSHVIFILATTEMHKVPQTILSRCQRFDFHRVHQKEMVERLAFIAKAEKMKVAPSVFETVARLSEGCVRDAESLLEQLFSLGEKEITEEVAGLVLPRTSWTLVLAFLDVLDRRDAPAGLALIERLVGEGIDLAQFSSDLIEMTRKILLIKVAGLESVAPSLDSATATQLAGYAQRMTQARILELIDLFIKAKQGLKGSSVPQLPLEIVVVEGCGVEKGDVSVPPQPPPQKPHSIPPAKESVLDAQPRSSASGGLHARSASAALLPGAATKEQTQKGEEGNKVLVEQVKEKWPEVLKRAQVKNHSLPFLLSTSEPLGVSGDMVTVGVQYQFHSDKLNEPKSRSVLESIITEIYGMPLRIQGTLMAQKELVPNSIDDVLATLGGRVVE